MAQKLKATLSLGNKKGVDVYDSRLYPGLTVQVKASRELTYKSRGGRKVFTFSCTITGVQADVCVLFGVKDGMAYPFVLTQADWRDRSSRGGNRDTLVCSSSQFHSCRPRQVTPRQSRFWSDFYAEDWPSDLHQCIAELCA